MIKDILFRLKWASEVKIPGKTFSFWGHQCMQYQSSEVNEHGIGMVLLHKQSLLHSSPYSQLFRLNFNWRHIFIQ